MNDKSEIVLFILGISIGIFLTISIILPIFGLTPNQIKREIHQEAINLGYGQWTIVNTNNVNYPTVQFQWVTK